MAGKFGRKNFEKDAARQRVINSLAPVAVGTVDHGSMLGLLDDDHSQYVHLSAVRTITAQHSFSPASAQAPFVLGANAQGQLVTGLRADQVNKTVTAGNGLTGGGLLTADITLNVAAGNGLTVAADSIALTTPGTLSISSSNNPAGSHTHAITASSDVKATPAAALLESTAGGQLSLSIATLTDLQTENVDSSLVPKYTDTYDLGSSTKLWRKGWLSEMEALLFVENTITLLGGWFWIPKDAGTLPNDITAVQTTIDFGKAVTPGSWVIFRSSLAVEYVLVGTLISGTNYNVTRNVDGSGGNVWAAGQPFAVLGVSGDGRIELNAYQTPRIQLIQQGATYNAQTELIRIGDLNGSWGYAVEKWGIAIGQYASTKPNITIDEDGVLRFRIYSVDVMNFSGGNADITGKLRMPGTGSAIAIGATPPTGAAAGTGIWIDRTGLYGLAAGVAQAKIDAATGDFIAGSGGVVANADGLEVRHVAAHDSKGELKFYTTLAGTTPALTITGDYAAASSEMVGEFVMPSTVARFNEFFFNMVASDSGEGVPRLSAYLRLTNVGYMQFATNGVERLYVSDTKVRYSGNLASYKNSTEYTTYAFVPLITPLTSTAWDGDGKSSIAKTSLDLQGVFGAPANIKAILVTVYCRDEFSSTGDYYMYLAPNATAYQGAVVSCSYRPNDNYAAQTMVVPCTSTGDIYYQIVASGAGTFDVIIQIWGYFI